MNRKPSPQPEIIALLRETPLFVNQPENILSLLASDLRLRTYRKGDVIFHQGDEGHSLLVMMHGLVRVYHLTPSGEETTVNILSRGQLLGEFSAIDQLPRSATAEAISPCTLLELSSERCLHYLECVPGLALSMCRQLAYKSRRTSTYAESIARLDIAGRLLNLLLLYKEEFGLEVEPGKRYVIDLGLNQSDLATLVGAGRGWVNQILREWCRRELVEFADRKITIIDLPRVQQELASRAQGTLDGF